MPALLPSLVMPALLPLLAILPSSVEATCSPIFPWIPKIALAAPSATSPAQVTRMSLQSALSYSNSTSDEKLPRAFELAGNKSTMDHCVECGGKNHCVGCWREEEGLLTGVPMNSLNFVRMVSTVFDLLWKRSVAPLIKVGHFPMTSGHSVWREREKRILVTAFIGRRCVFPFVPRT